VGTAIAVLIAQVRKLIHHVGERSAKVSPEGTMKVEHRPAHSIHAIQYCKH
jgi:hypothetical protein